MGDFFMQENKKKRDYLIFTLFYQFLICAILFGSIYALKASNSDLYESIKESYYNLPSQKDITIKDVGKLLNTNTDTPVDENNSNQATVAEQVTEKESSKEAVKKDNSLSATITGAKNSKSATESLPTNVSVSSYVLNQRMFLPVKGNITSRFGKRIHPITKEDSFHAGIDIAADTGTPIRAAFDGKVIVADYDDWNGYYLKIEHEGDIMTVYCHCEKLKVSKGDTVKAGDIIATVGSTGSSTGPHLHFELRIENVSYDPETALQEATNAV